MIELTDMQERKYWLNKTRIISIMSHQTLPRCTRIQMDNNEEYLAREIPQTIALTEPLTHLHAN